MTPSLLGGQTETWVVLHCCLLTTRLQVTQTSAVRCRMLHSLQPSPYLIPCCTVCCLSVTSFPAAQSDVYPLPHFLLHSLMSISYLIPCWTVCCLSVTSYPAIQSDVYLSPHSLLYSLMYIPHFPAARIGLLCCQRHDGIVMGNH